MVEEKPQGIPNNEIWYFSSNKETIIGDWNIYDNNDNNLTLLNHTFSEGRGILTFSGDIIKLGDYFFRKLWGVDSLTIPNSVTTITHEAFWCGEDISKPINFITINNVEYYCYLADGDWTIDLILANGTLIKVLLGLG